MEEEMMDINFETLTNEDMQDIDFGAFTEEEMQVIVKDFAALTKEQMEKVISDRCCKCSGSTGIYYTFWAVPEAWLILYINACDSWDASMSPEILDYLADEHGVDSDDYEDIDEYGQDVMAAAEAAAEQEG